MIYETPGVAFDALDALYREMKKGADEYAQRATANQYVVDKHHSQLQILFYVLLTFKPIVDDVLAYLIVCQLKQMIEKDPCMNAINVFLRIHPYGSNIGSLNFDLYDSPY